MGTLITTKVTIHIQPIARPRFSSQASTIRVMQQGRPRAAMLTHGWSDPTVQFSDWAAQIVLALEKLVPSESVGTSS